MVCGGFLLRAGTLENSTGHQLPKQPRRRPEDLRQALGGDRSQGGTEEHDLRRDRDQFRGVRHRREYHRDANLPTGHGEEYLEDLAVCSAEGARVSKCFLSGSAFALAYRILPLAQVASREGEAIPLSTNWNLILIIVIEFVVIVLAVGRPTPADYCADYRKYQAFPERSHHPSGTSRS